MIGWYTYFENHCKGVCSYAITGPNDLVNEFFTLEQIVLDDGTNNAAAQLRLLQRLDRNAFKYVESKVGGLVLKWTLQLS